MEKKSNKTNSSMVYMNSNEWNTLQWKTKIIRLDLQNIHIKYVLLTRDTLQIKTQTLRVNSVKRYTKQKKGVVVLLISNKNFFSNNAAGLNTHLIVINGQSTRKTILNLNTSNNLVSKYIN